jgi:ATP-dependent DNA helicase RecG
VELLPEMCGRPQENPYSTISELAEKLSISKRAVDKQVAKLKENGKIERVGPDKSGYWKIIIDSKTI